MSEMIYCVYLRLYLGNFFFNGLPLWKPNGICKLPVWSLKFSWLSEGKNVSWYLLLFGFQRGVPIKKSYLTCPVDIWRQRPKKSRDLIGQYTRVNVYWPIKSRDSLGLWRQSSTGHISIVLDIRGIPFSSIIFLVDFFKKAYF